MESKRLRGAWRALRAGAGVRRIGDWAQLRVREPSTWTGLAMIALVLASDPMQAQGLSQAISLILGGGLVASGPLPEATR